VDMYYFYVSPSAPLHHSDHMFVNQVGYYFWRCERFKTKS